MQDSSIEGTNDCMMLQSLSNSCYARLNGDNGAEWLLTQFASWDNLGWTALLAPIMYPTSVLMMVAILFNPDFLPKDGEDVRSVWTMWMMLVASMGMPSMFMYQQILSGFESNVSDMALINMEPLDAGLYMLYNTWWIGQHYPYSLIHITMFGPIYVCQMIWQTVKELLIEEDYS